jgi:hypothetical protein
MVRFLVKYATFPMALRRVGGCALQRQMHLSLTLKKKRSAVRESFQQQGELFRALSPTLTILPPFSRFFPEGDS